MKKFRPLNAGYILVYVVVLGCCVESAWTLFTYFRTGGQDSYSSMFFFWTLLLLPVAIIYGARFLQTVVEISPTHMRIVRPVLITPKPGAQRASFIFRQGENDNVLMKRTFEIKQLAKYGYVEDFGLRPEDKSGAKENAKMFPVHEVAFVMQDGRNCRMNAALYSPKKRREIFTLLQKTSGIEPTGKLASEIAEETKETAR